MSEVNELKARIHELESQLSKFQNSEFHPDWSLLEASRDSLRDHQRLMGQMRVELRRLADARTEQESALALTGLLEISGLLVDD